MGVDGTTEDSGHPGIPLDRRDLRRFLSRERDVPCEVGQAGLLHLDLAKCGQHISDVVQERGVGPHDEDAGPAQALAVGIEQERQPVQARGGLSGAGSSLDHGRDFEGGAHNRVLLGLDGRHYVAHGADPRPFNLRGEEFTSEVGLGRVGQVLVLVRRDLAALEAETPS